MNSQSSCLSIPSTGIFCFVLTAFIRWLIFPNTHSRASISWLSFKRPFVSHSLSHWCPSLQDSAPLPTSKQLTALNSVGFTCQWCRHNYFLLTCQLTMLFYHNGQKMWALGLTIMVYLWPQFRRLSQEDCQWVQSQLELHSIKLAKTSS